MNPINSFPNPLDVMRDGQEFECLVQHQFFPNLIVVEELRRSIAEVEATRKKYVLCYVANVIRSGINNAIDNSDDLPFNEMVNSVPADIKEVDVVLVTPGGLANQVYNFVNALRPRFEKVNFILLNMAMSAGTIFIMSGDEIIMSKQSMFGPIDPQIPNREGRFVPAQSILITLEDIQKRGEEKIKKNMQPNWSDVQLLRNIDLRDIGMAMSASKYSTDMVKDFLINYKFKTWEQHSSTGVVVTDEDKKNRADSIASLLCDHSEWKSHGHAINRDVAWNKCRLKITHSESVEGLDRAMRRMWALFYWLFENTPMAKIFLSQNYCIIRNATANVPMQMPKK